MTFLELAIKGVRNFTEFTRVPLSSGLNTVYGGNQSGKTTLWQVLRVMLMGGRQRGAEDVAEWGQAALTFRDADGETFSLAHHFGDGRSKLARREADGSFKPFDPTAAGQHPLHPHPANAPNLWPLCLGGSRWLPSLQSLGQEGSPADAERAMAANSALAGAGALEVVNARLSQLDSLGGAANQARQLETVLAECYARRALLAERRDKTRAIIRERAQLAEKRAALAAAGTLSANDLDELVRYLEDEAAHHAQRVRLDQTLVTREDELEAVPRTTLLRRPTFHLGWLTTAATGGLFQVFGLYPAVMGVGTLGGVLLAVAISRDLSLRNRRGRILATMRRLRQEMDALDKPLQDRYRDLLANLEQAGFASPRAAFTACDRLRHLVEREAALERALEAALDGDTPDAVEAELEALDQRIHGVQESHARLHTAGADAAQLARERDSLQSALHPPRAGHAPAGRLDISIEPHLVDNPAYREALDPQRERYCRRAGEFLAHFTAGEFTALEVNGSYYPTLHGEHPGRHVGASPGSGMADLIYLAQYLAMVETLDPQGHYPMVLDEPFLTLDAERRDLVYSALQDCARKRQVVLLTCQKFLTSPSDHIVLL
ncbi:MAG: AAA family ATPase [Nitrospirae bacterium]|nr:AAA family ATPase [Nitrospirota bacterium]